MFERVVFSSEQATSLRPHLLYSTKNSRFEIKKGEGNKETFSSCLCSELLQYHQREPTNARTFEHTGKTFDRSDPIRDKFSNFVHLFACRGLRHPEDLGSRGCYGYMVVTSTYSFLDMPRDRSAIKVLSVSSRVDP